ncbi:aldehyde dehydrogenase family protein [Neobacillus vireti]|nr:aldehyde dehydrogenase family protein [Neobacillus vireti]
MHYNVNDFRFEQKVGDPQNIDTKMGPLVSEQHYQKVKSYLEIAKDEKAILICGGKRPELPEYLQDGYYLEFRAL